MKRLLIGLVIGALTITLFPQTTLAHPGNTSSDGCHFCRTNCSKWGWTAGTRHGHGGQVCDSSKGPTDPLYTGGGTAVVTEMPQRVITTSVLTLSPTPTNIPFPTNTPTITPTNSPTPTKMSPTQSLPSQTPTATNTPSPEVKDVQKDTGKQSAKWWMINPFTAFLSVIFGWK